MKEELWPKAARQQTERRITDPYYVTLSDLFCDLKGNLKVRSIDVWQALNKPVGQRTQGDNDRLGHAMQALGWQRGQLRFGGTHQERCYLKGASRGRRRVYIYKLGETPNHIWEASLKDPYNQSGEM